MRGCAILTSVIENENELDIFKTKQNAGMPIISTNRFFFSRMKVEFTADRIRVVDSQSQHYCSLSYNYGHSQKNAATWIN